MRVIRPLADRFNEKVDRSGGPAACWPWRGAMKTDKRIDGGRRGHIRIGVRGTAMFPAHRLALVLKDGRDRGRRYEAAHLCDNPICCNPDHLTWMTHKQNLRDYAKKHGRIGVHKRSKVSTLEALEKAS